MSLDITKKSSFGRWVSIAPEIQLSSSKNPYGFLKPFYLTRDFTLYNENRFELTVTNFADPYGKIPFSKITKKGTIEWLEEHPIADGAVKVNVSADEDYTITPLSVEFAAILNQDTKGFNEWKTGETQSIFTRAFPQLGLSEGKINKEFDLIFVLDNFMFWGARNADGRSFDTEESRPTNLTIPLEKL